MVGGWKAVQESFDEPAGAKHKEKTTYDPQPTTRQNPDEFIRPNTKSQMFSINDYSYELPDHLIAQAPAKKRDRSRLLCLDRASGRVDHHGFDSLSELLTPDTTESLPELSRPRRLLMR